MNKEQITSILRNQRDFFQTGTTLDVTFRIHALQRLKACIKRNEAAIHKALQKDLGKSSFESYMCETGMVYSEISYMLRHIRSFEKGQRVRTPLSQFHAISFTKPYPYGTVLIMSPWNYPFMLTIEPLVDALAAGNTVVLKPSAYSPHTSEVIRKIISECFPSNYVAVVTGGRAENTCLLQESFDYIFFTGSQSVGREVMRQASAHLTPVTLELGGKSPCIVDKSANLRLAARRIVFGKFLNCGQTCVAPDYIYCDQSICRELTEEIKKEIKRQYGSMPLQNTAYGKIINEKHFKRLLELMDKKKVVFGGKSNAKTLQIEPTVLANVSFKDAVMQEEIFGPILPIVTYHSLDAAIHKVNSLPHPLALYFFTRSKINAKKVMNRCGFGGGCINDTIIHLATSEMGFGGFGASGMGSYHGKDGFSTFSHYKSIVDKKLWLDLPMRYQPYGYFYEKLIRFFLR